MGRTLQTYINFAFLDKIVDSSFAGGPRGPAVTVRGRGRARGRLSARVIM